MWNQERGGFLIGFICIKHPRKQYHILNKYENEIADYKAKHHHGNRGMPEIDGGQNTARCMP